MFRKMLKSKIHRATVTGCDLDYVGSLTLDKTLMEKADLVPNEQVDIYNLNNGNRFTTYVIEGPAGSGQVVVNGAAAHLADVGHLVIIASYGHYHQEEVSSHQPKVVIVDQNNHIS